MGLFFLRSYDRNLSAYLITVFAVFLYVIGCYADWDGLSSFGNRFFVSLTPLFVLGLAALFDWLARAWKEHRANIVASAATHASSSFGMLGLIFQWGTHLIPARGPISWRAAAYNQVAVFPTRRLDCKKLSDGAKKLDEPYRRKRRKANQVSAS